MPTSSIFNNAALTEPEDIDEFVCALEESEIKIKRGHRSEAITIDCACDDLEVIKKAIKQIGDDLNKRL